MVRVRGLKSAGISFWREHGVVHFGGHVPVADGPSVFVRGAARSMRAARKEAWAQVRKVGG